MRGAKLLKENDGRDRVLSLEEWEKYKSHFPTWYLHIAISAYRTAMRKGEILNLSVSRVDLKEGFIRLRP
jgi:integrase